MAQDAMRDEAPGATGVTSAEVDVAMLERLAGDLRSSEPPTRARAIARLGALPAEALPAIAERVQYLARLVIPAEDGDDAIRRFRLATGSRRADDMIDIAPGIGAVLAEDRGPVTGRAAERVLLIRSLERIDTLDAWRLVPEIFALTPEMWRWEKRRIVHRLGPKVLPALLLARAHRDADVRRWARDGVAQLGLASPADALQEEDPARLAMLVTAYSEVRDLDAMPVMVAFVDHPDRELREATRAAMERYGQNGVWQLRLAFRNKLASEPDLSWGWRRTMTELYERLDAARLAPVSERLDEAVVALDAGDEAAALRLVEEVLRDAPEPPRPEVVAGALARVAATMAGEDALRLVRRALWLAPSHPDASAWRARELFLEAELDRERGMLDLDAYRAALPALALPEERATAGALLPEVDRAPTPELDEPVGEEGEGAPLEDIGLVILALLGIGVAYAHRVQAREALGRLRSGRPAAGMLAKVAAASRRLGPRRADARGAAVAGPDPRPDVTSEASPEGEPSADPRATTPLERAWSALQGAVSAALVALGSPVVRWLEARALARRRRELGARRPTRREAPSTGPARRQAATIQPRADSRPEREPASLAIGLVVSERRADAPSPRRGAALAPREVFGGRVGEAEDLTDTSVSVTAASADATLTDAPIDAPLTNTPLTNPSIDTPPIESSPAWSSGAPGRPRTNASSAHVPAELFFGAPRRLEDTLDEPSDELQDDDTLDEPSTAGDLADDALLDGTVDPLAALLLSADPSDTLPGAPAPS
ncbi:MAG: hypothetical protein KF901_25350 [Myxococcales bacterium]|nr:hypothetical protein [Myxococcales bacterium]